MKGGGVGDYKTLVVAAHIVNTLSLQRFLQQERDTPKKDDSRAAESAAHISHVVVCPEADDLAWWPACPAIPNEAVVQPTHCLEQNLRVVLQRASP